MAVSQDQIYRLFAVQAVELRMAQEENAALHAALQKSANDLKAAQSEAANSRALAAALRPEKCEAAVCGANHDAEYDVGGSD